MRTRQSRRQLVPVMDASSIQICPRRRRSRRHRRSFHSQLSSIMESVARSALSQICRLVDEDSAELRRELSRLLSANSALAQKVNSLERELTSARGDVAGSRGCSRAAQAEDPRGPVPESPTIEGIFGKDWCMTLWNGENPCSPERPADPRLSDKCVGTQCEQITVTKIKEENCVEHTVSGCLQETFDTEEHEESTAEEAEQLLISYVADGSTCSLSFDQEEEQTVSADVLEEPSVQLMSINDTEQAFCTYMIPMEEDDDNDEDDNDEDDDVQFVQESLQETDMMAAAGPGHNRQQTLPAGNRDNSTFLDQESHEHFNVETVRGLDKGKFTCQICSRTFYHKGTLTHHMKSHKSNFCHICRQHFPHRHKLRSHTCVPPVPPKTLSNSCELCGKTFANQSALRIHYLVHTGEKPHRCSVCGKGFTQKGNLKCHLRIHSGERPFCCAKCGKTFMQKASLNNHLMTHRHREEKSPHVEGFRTDGYWCNVSSSIDMMHHVVLLTVMVS